MHPYPMSPLKTHSLSVTSLSLPELIERCLAGDQAAWNRLIQQHQKLVFEYARYLCGNYEDADDIAAQVFLRLYQSLHTFRKGRSFRSWLLRIVHNSYIDVCIRDANHGHLSLEVSSVEGETSYAERLADRICSLETACLEKEAVQRIVEGIGHLPGYQRLALQMFARGRSYEEIARETGVCLGTVKSRINRARCSLSARLNAE